MKEFMLNWLTNVKMVSGERVKWRTLGSYDCLILVGIYIKRSTKVEGVGVGGGSEKELR